MFFSDGFGKPFFQMLATHPPLDERIRALDPSWDGTFKDVNVIAAKAEPLHTGLFIATIFGAF